MTRAKRIAGLFFATVCALALGAAVIVATHPRPKTVLIIGGHPANSKVADGLRMGLAERGWTEGENIRFVTAPPAFSSETLADEARNTIDRNTDLVVTLTTQAALATRDIAKPLGIPLLMIPASDPVAVGLVSGNIHPGQNITGITFAAQEARRLEYLARIAPTARRIWIPFDPSDPSPTAIVARLRPVAEKLGLTVLTQDVHNIRDLLKGLESLPRDVDAIFIPPDIRLSGNVRAIANAALARRLPITTPHLNGVEQGALFSYGFDIDTLGKQGARLADLILRGTPAADLPIEIAEMKLSVNLTVADLLGITIPDDLLRHAVIVGQAGE